MSLSSRAKDRALAFFNDTLAQADPTVRLGSGSPLKALVVLPAAMLHAAVFQAFDSVRGLYLSRADSISERDMDLLASNLLEERLAGSRSTTTMRVYLTSPEDVTLRVFPYFSTATGIEFSPAQNVFIPQSSLLVDQDTGEYYASVRVFSTTLGADTFADAETIVNFTGLQRGVSRVTNPLSTTGGNPRESNAEFYERISTPSASTSQAPGLISYIDSNFDSLTDILIVSPGDPEMDRDELWTVDNVIPNLSRLGEPFAVHTDLGTLDFETTYGQAFSAAGNFTQGMVGERIAVDGDIERFRLIRAVPSPSRAVLTGYELSGSATAKVWGRGPKPAAMCDCYVWSPSVEVRSNQIDNRFFVSPAFDQVNPTKLYYTIAPGFGYTTFPESGRLVYNQGGTNEQVIEVLSVGTDGTGNFLELDGTLSLSLLTTDILAFWDMDQIELGDLQTPVLYLISVDLLDPSSGQFVERIPASSPGNYSSPGWYISATDPAELYSTRERKTLNIDRKYGQSGFTAINNVAGLLSSGDTAQFPGGNFNGAEGREVSITTSNTSLDGAVDSVTAQVATRAVDKLSLNVAGLGAKYFSDVGFRVAEVTFRGYDGGAVLQFTEVISDARVAGDTITRPSGGFDLADAGVTYEVDVTYTDVDPLFVHSSPGPFEVVILRGNGDEVTISEEIVHVTDGATIFTVFSSITAPSQEGTFGYGPVRLTYATVPEIATLQSNIDQEESLLVDDTLVRSYFPSIIDMSISYRGPSSARTLRSRFIELIAEAIRQDPDSELNVRVDLSNVIAALDDEGLADVIGLKPEIRITNVLADGEFEVRYLNPSSSTKLSLSHFDASSPGDTTVRLRKAGDAVPPGRGRLILGGQDEARFEMLPYEAVIESADHYEFVLRGTYTLAYAHATWEPAVACARDYDPELELTEGAIVIPRSNRPYLRNLTVERKS